MLYAGSSIWSEVDAVAPGSLPENPDVTDLFPGTPRPYRGSCVVTVYGLREEGSFFKSYGRRSCGLPPCQEVMKLSGGSAGAPTRPLLWII